MKLMKLKEQTVNTMTAEDIMKRKGYIPWSGPSLSRNNNYTYNDDDI